MATVLRFSKVLVSSTRPPGRHGQLAVRRYRWPTDTARWLQIQRAAWEPLRGARPWVEADFRREWLARPAWRSDQILLAYERPRPTQTVGAIGYRPSVHDPDTTGCLLWLAVVPAWQRRGAGRLLVATLERQCYTAGLRQLELETLDGWTAAVALYQQLGYVADD